MGEITDSHDFKYYAFISYKCEDGRLGNKLQEDLEHSRIPAEAKTRNPDLPEWIRPVFIDDKDISGNDLDEAIKESLRDSLYLIVVCSPLSARSDWVDKEIRYFIQLGRKERIIPFIIDGHPFTNVPAEECFPQAILELKEKHELILRGPDIRKSGWEASVVSVISTMFNLPFDSLWQRFLREEKRKRLKRFGQIFLLIALAVLILSILVFYGQKNKDRRIHDAVSEANALMDANRGYEAGEILLGITEERPHSLSKETEWAIYRLLKTQGGHLKNENTLKDMIAPGHGNLRTLVVSASEGKGLLQEWNLYNGRGKTIAEYLIGHDEQGLFNFVFGNNGKIVVTNSGKVLDGMSLELIGVLDSLPSNCILEDIAISSDGSLIAAVLGNNVTIWKDYSHYFSVPIYPDGMFEISPVRILFSPDNSYLAIDSGGGKALISIGKRMVSRVVLPEFEKLMRDSYKRHYSNANDGTGSSSKPKLGRASSVKRANPLVFSPDGNKLVSLGTPRGHVWDISQGVLKQLDDIPERIFSAVYSSQ